AWESFSQEAGNAGIYGQRVGAAGPMGAEFHVNTYTTGHQREPWVAADPSGAFVVFWSSQGQDGSGYGVYGQRYDAQGAPAGSEFAVNTITTGRQFVSGAAADAAGNFIVVFNDESVTKARRYR